MVVAQFWGFANDIYSEEEGKRLFVIIAFGASMGAVVGSFAAKALIEPLGTNVLLLVATGILPRAWQLRTSSIPESSVARARCANPTPPRSKSVHLKRG